MSLETREFWELGPYTLEVHTGQIVLNREVVKVGLRCFSVLVALARAEGAVVNKEDLLRAGWGTPHVDDSNLTHCITELRRVLALGFGDQTAVETLPRFGYRLAIPARRKPIPAPAPLPIPWPAIRSRRQVWLAVAGLLLLAASSAAAYISWSRMRQEHESTAHYQDALAALRHRGPQSLSKAAELFRRGIRLYPSDGRFYAGLAETMVLQRSVNHNLALDTARRAVALSPESAHGHAVLGFLHFSRLYDWVNGERELRVALEFDPRDTQAMLWMTLLHLGRKEIEQAEAQINRALAIDPNSPNLHSARAGVYYAAGKYDACVLESDLTISLQQDFPMAHAWRAKCHMAADRPVAFIDAITRARAVWMNADEAWREAAHQELMDEFKRGGIHAVHRKLLNYSTETGSGLVAFDQAISFASLGEADAALDLLEQVFERKSRDMIFLQIVPAFKPLHGTERWNRMLASMNLKP
jgi:DNA-binding winged helix-turn-helix (wHTH) protein/Tfp pilus assembly protein PilF